MDYPREYRLTRGWRYFLIAICLLLAVAMLAIAVLAGKDDGLSSGAVWLVGSPLVLLGLVGAMSVHRTRVTLHAGAIELQALVRRKRLERADIEGRRIVAQQHGPPTTRLISRTGTTCDITMPQFLETDAVLQAWIAAIPDRDAEERAQSEQAFLGDAFDEAARNEKVRRLQFAGRVAKVTNGATLLLMGWAWVHPAPYLLVVGLLAAVPVISVIVAATGKGAYTLEGRNNDVRASLALPFFLPGLVLLVRAVMDIHVFDWMPLLRATVVATLLCMLGIVWAAPELRKPSWVALLLTLFTLPYCYGILAIANLHFDDSEPQVFPTRVLDMRVNSGKTTTRYLEVEPWGPTKEAEDLQVSKELYERVRKGDTVCVYLFAGALRARWFDVWNCPAR